MKKEIITGRNGYGIPCINNISGGERIAVIISHGFGSSKESPTAQAVAAEMPKHGIGTISFDFPAHGESPVDGDKLSIENCLNDLAAVEEHVKRLAPGTEIAYFSSSFGAYLNLIYLSTREHAGRKSFLRCPAVDMPGLFRTVMDTGRLKQLNERGFFMLDLGYVRPLKITRRFCSDLDAHDVFKLYRPGTAHLMIIHGTADESAPIDDARCFAKMSGASLIEVEGADHRFTIPGGMEKVVREAVRFFTE